MSALLRTARAIAPPPAAPVVRPLGRAKQEGGAPRAITMAEELEFRWYLVQFLRDFRSGAKYADRPSGQALRLRRLTREPALLLEPSDASLDKRRSRAKQARPSLPKAANLRVPPFVASLSVTEPPAEEVPPAM
jgi:hypothetical protein